jgi:ATP-dependent DNA helicase RecQ
VAGGLLEVDVDGFGGMRLAGEAAAVLRGQRAVELRHDPAPPPGGRRARSAAPKAAPADLADDADRELFEALRTRRRELARAGGIAPFMVFPDRTLLELAARKPADLAALDDIHGIGQAKRERWGEDLLAVIHAHG